MPIMTSPWKHPDTGVYYFRRAVPADIKKAVGRALIKKSLNTKDPKEAKRLIVPYIAETDDLFSLARLRASKDEVPQLTVKDAAVIASRWYERLKAEIDAKGGDVGFVSKVIGPDGQVSFENISFDLVVDGSDVHRASLNELNKLAYQLSSYIDEQLRIEALEVPKDTNQYRWLAKEFMVYLYELESLCRARMMNDWTFKPAESIAKESLSLDKVVNSKLDEAHPVTGKGPILSEVLKDYLLAERAKVGKDLSRLKTLDGYETNFKRLIEIVGDLPIDGLTTQHLMKYRDTLLQMPKNKTREIRSLSVMAQIDFARENGSDLISPATVTNNLKQVSTVLNYAVESELIDVNPNNRVKKPQAKKALEASEFERWYSIQDLENIFNHEIFKDPKAHKRYGWASYWVPLICRYTGARLNEVGQLDKSDIEVEDGIYYFNIQRGEGQSIKSNSSLRHVPIHRHLIELGLLDYVNSIKSGALFPQVPLDKYGKASTKLSPWWAKTVREQGVDPKAPAHEFRHTLKTELRSFGVPDSVSDRITGHSAQGEGGRYGSVSLLVMKEVIDRLSDLVLERIYEIAKN